MKKKYQHLTAISLKSWAGCLLALVAAPLSGWAQTTYTWVGASGANFSTANSWSPVRSAPANNDILEFNGGTPSAVLDAGATRQIGRIRFLNNTSASFSINTSNNTTTTRTITVSATSGGDDFEVEAGSSLVVIGNGASGSNSASNLVVALNSGATARVAGSLVFRGTGGNPNAASNHKITGAANSVTFASGGSLVTEGTSLSASATPFGTTTGMAIFASGAQFIQRNGGDPYGPATFQAGSTYRFEGGSVPASLAGRTYGNLEYAYPTSAGLVYDGTSRLTVLNDLTLASTNQSTVSLNITGNATGGVAVGGNITVDGGALAFNPSADVNLTLNGTTPQAIQGAGSLTVSATTLRLLIDNPAGVTLLKPLTFRGLILTNGLLNTSASTPFTIALGSTSNGSSLVTGGSATSFVNGPMTVTASGANSKVLSFPVGALRNSTAVYRPISLSLTQSSATGTYSALQVEGGNAAARAAAASLQRVSGVRLFTLAAPGTTFTNGSLTLSYGADDQVNDGATLRVARSIGGANWENLGGTGSGTPAGTITANGLTALGDFTLATTAASLATNPLPVELASLAARRTAAGVVLDWTTAQEIKNDRFEVQRSLDGKAFHTIGSVRGQGSTTHSTAYSFLDNDPLPTASFYRLRQIDQDGTATDSYSVTVGSAGKLSISAYPNPMQDELFVQVGAELVQWRLLNHMGQPLRKGEAQGRTRLDLRGLPAGSYYLEVGQGGKRTVQSLLKTN